MSRDEEPEPQTGTEPTEENLEREQGAAEDEAGRESEDSFPASDPPSY